MKEWNRYAIGLGIGTMLMQMGRYKIHGYQILILAAFVAVIVFDLLNLKSKR